MAAASVLLSFKAAQPLAIMGQEGRGLEMRLAERLKSAAKRLRTETHALCLACRDPRTGWLARFLAAAVVAYALSPIDLIPDFIPILGLMDDLIVVPLGIWVVLKLIPPEVMAECREKASQAAKVNGRSGRIAAAVIIFVWVLMLGLAVLALARMIG